MTRLGDAAFLATRALRTVRVVYAGSDTRASFKQGDVWIEDANGYRTLEKETSLLFDQVTATAIGLAERTDITVYPVEDDTGTSITYRVKQLRAEQDGLYQRAVIGYGRDV